MFNYRISDISEVITMHGCCTPRHFLTREEKIEKLTEYKESLETEARAVSERIEELKKK